jgi:hypothetical protein
MITASLKTNLILKELGITRFSSRSSANKSIINSIYIYKIDKVSVFLKKDFKEYDIDQKKINFSNNELNNSHKWGVFLVNLFYSIIKMS